MRRVELARERGGRKGKEDTKGERVRGEREREREREIEKERERERERRGEKKWECEKRRKERDVGGDNWTREGDKREEKERGSRV